jgi:hypothetical protein
LFSFFPLSDDLSRLRFLVASLPDSGGIITIDKPVFFDSANRDFDNAIIIFADDRFFGDYVGNIISDRFPYFLPVPESIPGAAITSLPRGRVVRPEDGFGRATSTDLRVTSYRHNLSPSRDCWRRTSV